MKQIELSDEDLKELKGLLNVAISGCLDDSCVAPFEEQRKEAVKQANKYKQLYNKIFGLIYGLELEEVEAIKAPEPPEMPRPVKSKV